MLRSALTSLGIVGLTVVIACGPGNEPLAAVPPPAECTISETTVSPASATVHPGDTLRVTATISDCRDGRHQARWTSSDTTVATVTVDAGSIHAMKTGRVSIIATAVDNSAEKAAMALDVNP